MRLQCRATSAHRDFPVLLKPLIVPFDTFVSSFELDFNVSVIQGYKYPFTARSFEAVRDGVVIEPLLETDRDDACIAPVLMFSAATVPVELIYEAVIVPDALILRALNDVENVMVACFVLAL